MMPLQEFDELCAIADAKMKSLRSRARVGLFGVTICRIGSTERQGRLRKAGTTVKGRDT